MTHSAFELACAELWAIRSEEDLRLILDIAGRVHIPDLEAVEAARGERLPETVRASLRNGVASIPIVGPIFRRANLFTRVSGATSIETTATDLRAAIENRESRAIILNIDSPGGTVNGTNELAKMVRRASQEKPIVAYVSGQGASAAYWIASAAGAIFADETAALGSIGVIGTVIDNKDKREVTFVSSQTPRKRPDLSTEEGQAQLQTRVDKIAQIFIDQVAQNRGVPADIVARDFGQGDVLSGADAKAAGMSDGISSYEEVLADLAAGRIGADARRSVSFIRSEGIMTDKLTAASIAANHPEVTEALRSQGRAEGEKTGFEKGRAEGLEEGRKAGHEAGLAEGKTEGAKAERERIEALKEASLAGFEKVLEECIADGTSTAADLALKQQALLRKQGSKAADDLTADEKALAKDLPTPVDASKPTSTDSAKVNPTLLASEIRKIVKESAENGQTITEDVAAKIALERMKAAA